MSGYCYGDKEPLEECGLCGCEAWAEFCDVGVGMVQCGPYECTGCGAALNPLVGGQHLEGWHLIKPSDSGERVTGYYLTPRGGVIEMTFERGHSEFNSAKNTSTSALLTDGWVRITKLEGYAIDIPPFMSAKTRRALASVIKEIEIADNLGDPYVMFHGSDRGEFIPRMSLMAMVARLPVKAPERALLSP